MINLTFSLLFFSIVGVTALLIFKGFGHPIKIGYMLARGFFLIFGISILLLGVCFHLMSWPYATFFSPLFGMLGAQIGLWSIGISGEILGNRPNIDETGQISLGMSSLGASNYFFRTAITVGMALTIVFFISQYYLFMYNGERGKNLFIGSIDFIQQVHAETKLPERPNWVTETVKSTDRFGKGIEVEIGVLWDPYRWVKGSTEDVSVDDAEKVKFSIEEIIRNFQNTEKRPIIVVGTASHENAAENPEQEINRAQARADRLVTLCGEHFINLPHVYSLNLGAFKTDRRYSVFSASERRVILLVIKKGEDSLDLTSGVKSALIKAKEEQGFIFDAGNYSLFDTTRFQVMPRLNF